MADNQQPQDNAKASMPKTIEAKAPGKTEPTANAKPAGKASSGNGLLWFFVLLNLILLAAAAYGGYWFINERTVTQTKLDALQASVSQTLTEQSSRVAADSNIIKTDLTKQEATDKTLAENQQAMEAKVNELAMALEAAEAQLQEMNGRRPTDWLVAEADYLVRMAGRKMWLEQDVRTAIMLLGNADKRLQSLSDSSVLPVRALIAQDIQALQQVNPTSQVSVALALDGMSKQINKLPLDAPEENYSAPETAVTDSAADWKQNLLNVWHSLVDDFISVDFRDEPVEPLMTAKQKWLAQEQLKLALQQAQAAALASEQALFVASLEQAMAILSDNFLTDSPEVAGFETALNHLKATDISKAIPTELSSQAALEALLDSRVKRVFGEGVSAL